MNWISTKEIGEFDDLFNCAQSLGLNEVWIYGYTEDGHPVSHYNDQWENISDAAWRHGFLRKWRKPIQQTWRCSLPDPCACDPACWPTDYYPDASQYGPVEE